jgi:hypothetical protein
MVIQKELLELGPTSLQELVQIVCQHERANRTRKSFITTDSLGKSLAPVN